MFPGWSGVWASAASGLPGFPRLPLLSVSLGQNRSAALSLDLSKEAAAKEAAAKAQFMRWLEGASACSLHRPSARDEMTGVDGAFYAGDVDQGICEGVEPC